MAKLTVSQGRDRLLIQGFETSGYNAARNYQVIAIDDNATGFADGHTALNSAGTVNNEYDAAFDSTPADPSGNLVSASMTTGTGNANFTQRRFSFHDDTAGNVSASSTTLMGGADGFALTKTSDVDETVTMTLSVA